MRILPRLLLIAAALCFPVAAASAQHFHGADPAPQPLHPDSVPLWPGLRDHVHHEIATDSARAQQYFDQGLALIYGFNHVEAVLSFQRAYRIDPRCAMCYWGKAVALGPNINQEMDTTRWRQAARALDTAKTLARPGMETAYIAAASARYLPLPDFQRLTPKELRDRRAQMDTAYAVLMGKVWDQSVAAGHPDLDAGTIAAEARMDLRPWDQWDLEGNMQPGTQAVLTQLDQVLQLKRDHVGAAHLWIHALEGSQMPGAAEWAADTLSSLMPGAGHIAHMPSHIDHRLGRYADGVGHNRRAVKLDSAYLAFRGLSGRYPMYWAHNHDFLWVSASYGGMRDDAMRAARALESIATDDLLSRFYNAQHFLTAPILVHVRFGEWDQALAVPRPRDSYTYALGIWHYGQGMARLRKGDVQAAMGHLGELKAIAGGPTRNDTIMGNPVGRLLGIAAGILDGEILAQGGQYPPAITALQRAVALQDSLNYDEPPPFPYAARHSLGAVLLAAGRAEEARGVYLCDLARELGGCRPALANRGPLPQRVNRNNPWSLMGMVRVMLATGQDPGTWYAEFRQRWGGAPEPPGSRW